MRKRITMVPSLSIVADPIGCFGTSAMITGGANARLISPLHKNANTIGVERGIPCFHRRGIASIFACRRAREIIAWHVESQASVGLHAAARPVLGAKAGKRDNACREERSGA